MTTPANEGAAPDDAPRTLFTCPELADFLEASFENDDLAYDTLEMKSFTFTPVT